MSSAILRIHAPSRPTAGSSSTSDATRSGRAAASFSATAQPNECPTTTTGRVVSPASNSASAATLESIVHGASHDDRPWPSRSGATTAKSGRCSVASVCQRRPCPVSPWTARICAGCSGPKRCTLRKCVLLATASMLRAARWAGLVGPSWCHAHMSAPHIAPTSTALTEPGIRGVVRVLGGPGTGKTSAADRHRRRPYRGRRRPGIGSAADGFGAARRAGARRHHVGAAAGRAVAPWCVSRWCARCTPTRSRCCGWPRSATVIRRRG